jgi:ribosomal protein S18 acetylase RimI-like enzyme
MTALIRHATPADGPGIAYVRVTTWRDAYRGIIPQAYLDSMNIPTESVRWSEGLAHAAPQRCYFVAEMEGAQVPGYPDAPPVVGYVMAGPNREEDSEYGAELYAIYVLPEYHGQGLGRALFTTAAEWLVGQGHSSMIVYVLKDNAPSRRFYEAMGGRLAREQLIETGGTMLPEVGYGYELCSTRGKK